MSEKFIKREIIKIGRLMFKEGLIDGISGNIGYFYKDRFIFITRHKSFLGDLKENDIIIVDTQKNLPTYDRASSEFIVYREFFTKTRQKALVHAHPIFCVLLSFKEKSIVPIDSEGKEFLKEVNVLDPPFKSASLELSKALIEEFENGRSISIIKTHGVFSWSSSLFDAYSKISSLEHSCKILSKL